MEVVAREIAEGFLRRTGDALLSGHFEAFAECFAVPHVVEAPTGVVELETESDLREKFMAMHVHLRDSGVTMLDRQYVSHNWLTPTSFKFTHKSRIVSGASLIQKPFFTQSVVKRIDGVWLLIRSSYLVTDNPSHAAVLSAPTQSAGAVADETTGG